MESHEDFLKRNGTALVELMGTEAPSPGNRDSRPLVTDLLILVATGKPPPLIDGRVLRGLEKKFHPDELDTTDVTDWRDRLSTNESLPPGAAKRVSKLLVELVGRDDFPELGALEKWGIHYWRDLFESCGMDPRKADTVASLMFDRHQYLPGGEPYTTFYERLGLRTNGGGNAHPKALFPSDSGDFAWGAAHFAHNVCTPDVNPGGEECDGCPIRGFCRAYREASGGPNGHHDQALEVVDLFAGAGGLSTGLEEAGFRVRCAVEKDEEALDTFLYNRPTMSPEKASAQDVRKLVDNGDFIGEHEGVSLVVGGPPCQPYSLARRHRSPEDDDPRLHLFKPFVEIARELGPRMVIMENVPGLLSADDGDLFERVKTEFSDAGFEVGHRMLEAEEFGVPQERRRVFVVAVNEEVSSDPVAVLESYWEELESQKVPEPATVGDALSGVPKVEPGGGGLVHEGGVQGRKTPYAEEMLTGSHLFYNHIAREHNERDIGIFSSLREGERAIELHNRWKEKNPSKPDEEGPIPYDLSSFKDKFRKLDWNSPAPTIPAHLARDANAFVHPKVPRGITCREAARLQSFPDDYLFLGGFGSAFRQVGNAVPPKLAEAVGRAARSLLEDPSHWID